MDSICFNTDREISEARLMDMIQQVVPVTSFEWAKSIMDLDNIDQNKLYVEKRVGAGQFNIYFNAQVFQPVQTSGLRWKVDLLKGLAKANQANILLDDEGPDPYLFIHIDPSGDASSVGVVTDAYDDKGELSIDGYYNLAFGSFALETPIKESEIAVLRGLIEKIVPVYELSYADGAISFFNQFKDRFERLQKFVHHYFVIPTGKQEWYSRDEKGTLFSSMMTSFGASRKVCFFPANASTTENIPGGSDSEQFCICLDGSEPAKIIYKERRKSWPASRQSGTT